VEFELLFGIGCLESVMSKVDFGFVFGGFLVDAFTL
jgi:hypothetical protein